MDALYIPTYTIIFKVSVQKLIITCINIQSVCLFFFITGNDCENLKVGITLQSEYWKSAFNNRESIEYKTLESKLLSEVSFLTYVFSHYNCCSDPFGIN